MTLLQRAGMRVLRSMDPERAHGLALKVLQAGLVPAPKRPVDPVLTSHILGLEFPNPVGLAAGFDKNAEVYGPLLNGGFFGFVEIGAVTPRPQPGNPRPRVFRLNDDRAVINRMGFNNNGLEAMRARLLATPRPGILGVNIGANKDSADRASDYATVIAGLYGLCDFFTVNVSSPNTEKLRDLQGPAALRALLERALAARDAGAVETGVKTPVLLKIAPDLTDPEIDALCDAAEDAGIDGIIATNTTLARPDSLKSIHSGETGGLSGAPLREKSLAVLRRVRARTGGRVPLIGVGGIATAEDAYARIRAGASLVQLYSALVYAGPGLGADIARGLADLLRRDGVSGLSEAIGADA